MKDALRQIPAQQPDLRPQQETPSVMDIWEIVVVEYHASYVCRSVCHGTRAQTPPLWIPVAILRRQTRE
jgi:hypothetical protein